MRVKALERYTKPKRPQHGVPNNAHCVLCERAFEPCSAGAYDCYIWNAHGLDPAFQVGECFHNLGSIRTVYNAWYPSLDPPKEELPRSNTHAEAYGLPENSWEGFKPHTLEGMQMEGKGRRVGMGPEGPHGTKPGRRKREVQGWAERLAGYVAAGWEAVARLVR
jgi:hypothetical protein